MPKYESKNRRSWLKIVGCWFSTGSFWKFLTSCRKSVFLRWDGQFPSWRSRWQWAFYVLTPKFCVPARSFGQSHITWRKEKGFRGEDLIIPKDTRIHWLWERKQTVDFFVSCGLYTKLLGKWSKRWHRSATLIALEDTFWSLDPSECSRHAPQILRILCLIGMLSHLLRGHWVHCGCLCHRQS